MSNKLCPYTCRPISEIAASCEHIVPDALGGPSGFALTADTRRNSTYGATVDSRLVNSPFLGMLAARGGVQTRTAPATWRAKGNLLADGSAVHIVGSADSMAVRFQKPVETDPETGQIRAVKGFGADAKAELARVAKDLNRKGRFLEPDATRTLDSTIRGRLEHNLSEVAQGLTKIAYLATVWTVGDEFISTDAGAKYRSWIDAEPNAAALDALGLRPLEGSLCKKSVPHTHHLIACVAMDGKLITGVRLFNEPLFEITLAVPVPELHLANSHGRLIVIDASRKAFEEMLLAP